MTKNNDHSDGCILPRKVVDITMCCIEVSSAQKTTQTLLGGGQKTTPAYINFSAG